ncbi:phenylalanine--tRNA ligase subunit beta [Apilactobacillus sp. TMW 2.2459]|uniref:phenylalanine--tRNA ligase subunit beta n=1 Tax=Apilactobacillus xinyiensis TaxID=2841032 RepID=UPI00200C619F|nr:phenylalanine--tRNA ligase subunit beta [Apilactobacillus xinyiensis]MCL0311797.1 phenylalanine--tRNA ligase subunit beta [Apilactobacillus xinyiensis]
MQVSYKWLKEYIDLDVSADELAEKIERSSVEVDSVVKPSAGLKKIVVGQILSLEDHPDSDHLHICQIDVGEDEPLQIVCGAPNVAVNKKVIVALPGSRIADNVKIKKSKMRGVPSFGMLCALDEIGFPKDVVPKEWADGIYFLPDDAKLGDDVYDYIGMNDELIDLDVTPNRGDMLSMYGTLRDLSAIYNKPVDLTYNKLNNYSDTSSEKQFSNAANIDAVKSYKNRVINNVTVKPSPLWLQIRLWNAGIKPINNVVDITNYIMIKLGQPMHAYDLDKINGNNITVRNAKSDEKIITLDEDEVSLNDTDLVIADDKQPIAMAGVIGGLNTSITSETKNVVLECAVFDPIKVRKMARKHVIHTEASQRFERGVDVNNLDNVLEEASFMINDLANGDVCEDILTAVDHREKNTNVNISLERINHVLGTNLELKQVIDIFERLGFGVKANGNELDVDVPTRRGDIHIDSDLIEEVARIYGYDNLPSTLPSGKTTIGMLSPKQQLIRNSRNELQALGLTHAISYSLTTPQKANMFLMQDTYETDLSFPMSTDHSVLRMNLVTGLLDDVAYNQARNVKDVALYEQGRVFYKDSADQVRPNEVEHIAAAISGTLDNKRWNNAPKNVDFYDVKGILDSYLKSLQLNGSIEYVATDRYPEMHPGRTADVLVHGHYVGFIGQVHPRTAKEFHIKETYVFDLNLETLIDLPKQEQQYDLVSKYPSISRDIAMLVDENVTNQQIMNVIVKRGGAYLTDVNLFDVYNGKNVPDGKKSMAYSLTYQNKKDTLTDDEVNKAFDKVERNLVKEFDAEIR